MSPASMTTRTPSMVKLVSAMEVASTTLRVPGDAGPSAASCSPGERSPNRGSSTTDNAPARALLTEDCDAAAGGVLLADDFVRVDDGLEDVVAREAAADGGEVGADVAAIRAEVMAGGALDASCIWDKGDAGLRGARSVTHQQTSGPTLTRLTMRLQSAPVTASTQASGGLVLF